VSLQGC
jgi:COP9 signalosome complex subunit 7